MHGQQNIKKLKLVVFVTSKFLKVVVIKITIFLDVVLCSLVDIYQSFAKTSYINLDYREAIHSNYTLLLEKITWKLTTTMEGIVQVFGSKMEGMRHGGLKDLVT
jgi:hypothetical protein